MWNRIRDSISSITKNSHDYDEKYMKIKFNWDDELSLNKTIEIGSMIIVVRAVFHENIIHKFSQMSAYINYEKMQKCYIMIELAFLKELVLIRQANHKSEIFVTIGIFYIKDLSFNHIYAIDVVIQY